AGTSPAMTNKADQQVNSQSSPRSANVHLLPAVFLFERLVNGGLRQFFSVLRRGDCLVEVAGFGRLLGGGERGDRRGRLIAQLAGLVVGGLGRGIGRLEIGFGAGRERGHGCTGQQDGGQREDEC